MALPVSRYVTEKEIRQNVTSSQKLFKIKKIAESCLTLSGKRESVHLLLTLYIKQLPLPNTILPIRGTLGLFQGVIFESDFSHTNFRTTVAYDKFTNNF